MTVRALKPAAKAKPAAPSPPQKPCIVGRNLALVEGPRHARRPSKVARKAGSFNAAEVAWPDEYVQPDSWAEDLPMPKEARPCDEGWLVGPCGAHGVRRLPAFAGPTPGPTDDALDASASVLSFFSSQITQEFCEKVVEFTRQHCEQWCATHPDWRTDTRELAVRNPKKHFGVHEFRLWLACRLRISQLKPELPAYSLWNRHCSLFDTQVFATLTFNQYQWVNRHVSFADVQVDELSDSEDESEGESEDSSEGEIEDVPAEPECDDEDEEDHRASDDEEDQPRTLAPRGEGDCHRKRRVLTELACASFSRAWSPHQFVGLDEAVRSHKHWGKQRIRKQRIATRLLCTQAVSLTVSTIV